MTDESNGRMWEVSYDRAGVGLMISAIRYHGAPNPKTLDWNNYRKRKMFSICVTRTELEKLRRDIDFMLDYAVKHNKMGGK